MQRLAREANVGLTLCSFLEDRAGLSSSPGSASGSLFSSADESYGYSLPEPLDEYLEVEYLEEYSGYSRSSSSDNSPGDRSANK